MLGLSGRLDGDDIVDVILTRPACGRYIAGKVITYLEGVEPDEARLDEYATFLADNGYEMKPMLRKLLTDPRFFREEVRATRVAGPIDILVGMARRLDIQGAERVILASGAVLGQELFATPNVKGWDGGLAWINTNTMIQRGNLAGVMLGRVEVEYLLREDPSSSEPMVLEKKSRALSSGFDAIVKLQQAGWQPEVSLRGFLKGRARTDEEIVTRLVSDLLTAPIDDGVRSALVGELSAAREGAGIAAGALLADERSEPMLRRVVHLLLSLPEAQLN